MDFHDASNIFPLDEEHLQELADDIREHGLQVPVELCEGKILDGRRRWKACKMAGVKPCTIPVKPEDPVAYVLSLNLHRRHLTVSQAAMCAQRARKMYDDAAKERQKLSKGRGQKGPDNCSDVKGEARDQVGQAFSVSGGTVDRARRVLEKGTPALIKAVDEGRMAVSTAAILATEPPEVQDAEVTKPKRNRRYGASRGGAPVESDPTGATEEDDLPEGVSRGVGVRHANEAIDCLMRIPKNDPLRKRGFQIVTDWIRRNR